MKAINKLMESKSPSGEIAASDWENSPNFCRKCENLGMVFVEGRGAKPCDCREIKMRAARLAEVGQRLRAIPAEFQFCDLRTLQPDPERHAGQGEIIRMMLAEPGRSIGLFGANGLGKTMLSWGLVRLAIEAGRPAIGIKLRILIKQYQEAQFNPEIRPAITVDFLRRTDERVLVFLDDIGLITPSAFAAGELFDIVDEIYESRRHQLVLTSHSSLGAIEAHLNRAGDNWGTAIRRRIEELHDMQIPEL